jgi:glycosyltransferase involved in cell wall biosynthesis
MRKEVLPNASKGLRLGIVLHGDYHTDIRVMNELQFLCSIFSTIGILTPRGCYVYTEEPRVPAPISKSLLPKMAINFLFASANSLPFFSWYWAFKIKQFVARFQIDLLHVHDLYMGEPASKVAASHGIPYIIDLHEDFPEAVKSYAWVSKFPYRWFSRPDRWTVKEEFILRQSVGIITLSEAYWQKLAAGYPFLRGVEHVALPNYPDLNKLLSYPIQDVAYHKSGFTLLYFGVIGQRRGLHTASAAVKKLNGMGHPCRLLVIGNVHKAEKPYFERDVLNEYVDHIPWIDLSELPSYLAVCDACISPLVKNPHHESGIANKVYQYMLFGKPLLVSNCAPQEMLVIELGCGLVHQSEDVDDFVEKVKVLMSKEQELNRMGELGKQAVLEKYNTKESGRRLLEFYRRVLDRVETRHT